MPHNPLPRNPRLLKQPQQEQQQQRRRQQAVHVQMPAQTSPAQSCLLLMPMLRRQRGSMIQRTYRADEKEDYPYPTGIYSNREDLDATPLALV